MSDAIVPSNYNVQVDMGGGEIVTINLFQMRMMALAVTFRADIGVWPPSVNKLGLTRQSICERFHIDPAFATTYKQLGETLTEVHADLFAQFKDAINAG